MGFGEYQFDRVARGSIFAAFPPVVLLDPSIDTGSYSGVERTVPAADNINVPRRCSDIIHRGLFSSRGRFLGGPSHLTPVRYYFSHHVEPIFLGNVGVNK